MLLTVIKIVVTSAMVLGLSWLSERVGPKVAGVFAGFPLGIAVSLFFIGVEQGPDFAATAATSTVGGLSASLAFCVVYWLVSKNSGVINVVLTSVLSLAAFFGAAALISLLPQDRWVLTGLTVIMVGLAILIFRKIQNVSADSGKNVVVTPLILLVRAAVATAIVLAITGLASAIGEEWSGLLSGFTITLYPVLVIVHVTYSEREVHGIIKNFPFGIGSLIIFALTGSLLFAPLGIYWGALVAVVLSSLYLAAVSLVMFISAPKPDTPSAASDLPNR
ncbi:MAG: hypothetical protein AAF414_05960 [Pseudomonadota bacterium]